MALGGAEGRNKWQAIRASAADAHCPTKEVSGYPRRALPLLIREVQQFYKFGK